MVGLHLIPRTRNFCTDRARQVFEMYHVDGKELETILTKEAFGEWVTKVWIVAGLVMAGHVKVRAGIGQMCN